MVFGGQGVSQRVAGADEGTNGGASLWGRARGDRRGTGGGNRAGGFEETEVEGRGFGRAAQGKRGQVETGAALANGNNCEREMDRGTAPDGYMDAPQSPAILAST